MMIVKLRLSLITLFALLLIGASARSALSEAAHAGATGAAQISEPTVASYVERVEQAYRRLEARQAAEPPAQSLEERLARLAEIDQAGRKVFGALDFTLLPEADRKRGRLAAYAVVQRHDREVEQAFVELVPAKGWFPISRYGVEVARSAFLIVQHAEDRPELMRLALARLEEILPSDPASGRYHAMLFDRIAMDEGRPQRFGTQMVCKTGRYVPYTIEDPDALDQRRREAGFSTSMEDYVSMFKDNPPCVEP